MLEKNWVLALLKKIGCGDVPDLESHSLDIKFREHTKSKDENKKRVSRKTKPKTKPNVKKIKSEKVKIESREEKSGLSASDESI